MSSWDTNPWYNFYDPHWQLICDNKLHPGTSEISTPPDTNPVFQCIGGAENLLTKRQHWLMFQCFHDKLLKALMEKLRNNEKGEIGDWKPWQQKHWKRNVLSVQATMTLMSVKTWRNYQLMREARCSSKRNSVMDAVTQWAMDITQKVAKNEGNANIVKVHIRQYYMVSK